MIELFGPMLVRNFEHKNPFSVKNPFLLKFYLSKKRIKEMFVIRLSFSAV